MLSTSIAFSLNPKLAVSDFVPVVKAQEPSLPSTVWSEFSSFEPQMLADYPSGGYLTWNTTYGLYTMDKSLYWFSFKDRYGVQQVSKSVFWINTTATIDIAKIVNVQATVKNDTVFQVKYSATYKGGGLTKDTVIGNFTVTHTFSRDQKPKISVQFVKDAAWSQGGLGDFNIVWVLLPTKAFLKINEISAVDYTAYTSMINIKEATVKEDKKCEVGGSADPVTWTGSWSLTVWDDVDGTSVIYAGLDKVFGSKGVTVVFPVNDGEIDPSTVGTSTSSLATYYPFQRKSFYANGRFWVFFSDGTNMVYCTSTDGTTWSTATTVRACSSGAYFSIWFDGTYLHYAYAPGTNGGDLMYRRGTPNADGTITWSTASEVIAYDATYQSGVVAEQINYPFVSVDSNGYPFIAFKYYDAVGLTGSFTVTKSSTNDGTWTTATGFPKDLSLSSIPGIVIPLTSGKMLAVYASDSAPVNATKWDGSAWGTEVATTSSIYSSFYLSAVAQGDDVHLTFLKSTGYDILYVKYTYSSNSFGSETTLQAGATSTSAPVLSIDTTTNNLYVFWAGYPTANHIYYRKYTASTSTWETAVDWITETALTDNDRLTCFYQAYGRKIGLVYMTGTVYYVKFAYLDLNNAPTNDALTLDLTGASYKGTKTLLAGKQDYKFVHKCSDADGVTDITYAEIRLDYATKNVILRATRGAGDTWTFSEQSDPSNYVTLNVAGSSHSTSGNQKTFNYLVTINWNWDDATETLGVRCYVVDSVSVSDQDDYANIFGVENDLSASSLTVNDYHVNPSQTLTMSGCWYYEGTSIYPPNGDYQVKIKLSGVQKGSTDTSLVSGYFSISDVTAQGTVGSYSYTVEATYMASAGTFPAVVVDDIEVYAKDDPAISGSSPSDFVYSSNPVVGPQNWYSLISASFVPLLFLSLFVNKLPKRLSIPKPKREWLALVFLLFFFSSCFLLAFNHVPTVKANPVTRVQGNARGTSTSTSISVTMASTPTSGNVLIATIGTKSSSVITVSSVTQTGVTWSYVTSKTYSLYTLDSEIWFGVVGSGASTSITVTLSGTAGNGAVADVCEYSGLATSDYLDKTASASGSSTSTSTGTTATTTQANELWLGAITVGGLSDPQSSPTNGFSMLDGNAYFVTSLAYLEKIVSSTGTANSHTTLAGEGGYAGCIATFKAVQDTTPPTYSNIGANTTIAGNPCLFFTKWTDNVGLATTGGFILSTNNTGLWANQTWTAFTANPDWSNKTLTLNTTVGVAVQWLYYANDTSNNWNSTAIQTLTTTYSAPPQYSNVAYNTTISNSPCLFSVYWADDQALSGYIFGTNNTGSWINETWTTLSGTGSWANVSKTLPLSVGVRVEYQWWANDSQGQWNDTGIQYLITTNPGAPTYSNIATNTTNAGAVCLFSSYWQDNVQLSGFIFSTNNTGTWINETWTSLSGSASWANITKTLNSTIHITIGYRWYCNDTGDNWGDTGIQTIYLISQKSTSVPVGTYVIIWFKARYDYDKSPYTSASGSTLSINGTSATYDSQAGYWWVNVTQNAVGNYTYIVNAVSDGVYGLTVINNAIGGVTVWYSVNYAPTIGEFQTPSIVYANKYFFLNLTINDQDGVADFVNTTIEISYSIILKWDNATGTFSEYQDTNSYCTLDVSGSIKNSVNSTAYKLSFKIKLTWTYPEGSVSVIVTNTKVCDSYGDSGSNSQTSLFTFEDDLIIHTDAIVNDSRVNPSQSITFTASIYYQGTTTAPEDVTGITAYVELSGIQKGSDTDVTGGLSVTINAETGVGLYSYNIYCVTDENSVTNQTVNVIVERILIESGGAPSPVHAGDDALIYYVLKYETDLSLVSDGNVLLNGTSMTYNTGRWELNVTSQTLGNYSYRITAVSGNMYGIVTLNDTVGLQTVSYYVNVYLRTVDVESNVLTEEATVYFANGTATVPSLPYGGGAAIVGVTYNSQTTVNGWANWTGQTNTTVQVYVTWKGLTVNSTFTLTLTTDTTLDLNCLCYPYTPTDTRYWAASNATILSAVFASDVLTVTFNASTSTYLLVASSPSQPRYITNVTYDLVLDFADGYLTLPHYGNATLKLSYETVWGGVYVQKTDKRISTASWNLDRLTMTLLGSYGDIGNLEVYCLPRGSPALTDGFVTTTYAGGVFKGNYVMSSGSVTVFIDWHGGGSPGTGPGGGGVVLGQLLVKITFNLPSLVDRGATVNGTMNVTWTGFPLIYVWNIETNVPYTSWTATIAGLPLSLKQTMSGGFAVVPVTFKVPADQQSGSQLVPVAVSFAVPAGTGLKTLISIVSVQVASPPQPVSIPNVMVFIFLGMLGSVPLFALFRTRKKQNL